MSVCERWVHGGRVLSISGSCVCVVDGPALGVYLEVVAGERFFLKVLPWWPGLWETEDGIRPLIYTDELSVCPRQGLLRSTAPQQKACSRWQESFGFLQPPLPSARSVKYTNRLDVHVWNPLCWDRNVEKKVCIKFSSFGLWSIPHSEILGPKGMCADLSSGNFHSSQISRCI